MGETKDLEKENNELKRMVIKQALVSTATLQGTLLPEGLAAMMLDEFRLKRNRAGILEVVPVDKFMFSPKNPGRRASVNEAVEMLTSPGGTFNRFLLPHNIGDNQADQVEDTSAIPAANQQQDGDKAARLKGQYVQAKKDGDTLAMVGIKTELARMGQAGWRV